MKKLAAIAVVPLFAGFLFAQTTETTTTTTTYNGTLLDAGCVTTHTQTTERRGDETSSTKTETNRYEKECPVTTTTTTFSLLTPEGKVVRFDEAGNAQVVEMVKNNKQWTTYVTERKPIKVKVHGKSKGDVIVVEKVEQ